MSKYTTEVRFICESKAGLDASVGYNSIDEIVTTAAPLIFNFDFPIFDENYRLPLEKRILKNFYTREICEETVGLWQLRMENKLNLIMPFYNRLFESELLEFNPFYDVDLFDEHTKKGNDTRNTSANRVETGSKDGTDSENINRGSNRNENAEVTQNTDKKIIEDTNENTSKNRTVHETGTKEGTENERSNNTKQNGNNSWDLFSDTPQSGIDGVLKAGGNLTAQGYLSTARNQFGDTTENGANTTDKSNNETNTVNNNENESAGRVGSKQANENGNNVEKRNAGITETGSENRSREFGESDKRNINENENTVIGSLEDYAQHVFGKRGGASYSKMLEEFRKTFLRIEQMLMDELGDLFFGLW